MFKLIIAGSRSFKNYETLCRVCDFYLQNKKEVLIISGGARGADALGLRYAKENQLPVKIYKPNWQKYGRAGGIVRNLEMANNAHGLLAFWNGASSGTKNMLQQAQKKELKIHVHYFNTLFSQNGQPF
ncbi:MAG: DUF2493 domain-containing protein [Balneolaceae bacterium]